MMPFDPAKPNVARIYDVLLGGKDNFEADREAAGRLMKLLPDARASAHANRLFLRRAVRHVTAEGITQLVDIGSGLPAAANTHQVARACNPECRVAYVDYDPVVVNHAHALLAGDENVTVTGGDLRRPDAIAAELEQSRFIDWQRPVAVMLVAILHFVAEPACYEITGYLRDRMAPGSCLVLSHATADQAASGELEEGQSVYAGSSSPIYPRSRDEVARFFGGLDIAAPGVTGVDQWQARSRRHPAARVLCYGGVARKPAPDRM